MWKLVGCLLVVLVTASSGEEKIPVSVYYESLCPDSIQFVTEQLVPTYNTPLKNYINLEMVPYGKATHQRSEDHSRWNFKCHHGPVECYGNKVHGCILEQIPDEQNQLKYIDCLMRQAKTLRNEFPLNGCISGSDLNTVTGCANATLSGPNGADILAKNGDKTAKLSPPLTSVPTVVFNGSFNKTVQDMARTDFKKVLCSYLEEECPSECKSAAGRAISSAAAILFFIVFRYL